MTAINDNPHVVQNVRVAAVPDPVTGVLTIRLAGVAKWLVIYDGGVPLERSDSFPPAFGQWSIGPDGWPCLGTAPVRTLTADVAGADLPPSHVFHVEELAGWTMEHRLQDLFETGLFIPPPNLPAPSSAPAVANDAAAPNTSKEDKLAAACVIAITSGQFELAGRIADALKALGQAAGVERAMSPTGGQGAGSRRDDRKGRRR